MGVEDLWSQFTVTHDVTTLFPLNVAVNLKQTGYADLLKVIHRSYS